MNTEQRSTTEKDPPKERALLRERTGVLDGEEKRFKEAKKDEETSPQKLAFKLLELR